MTQTMQCMWLQAFQSFCPVFITLNQTIQPCPFKWLRFGSFPYHPWGVFKGCYRCLVSQVWSCSNCLCPMTIGRPPLLDILVGGLHGHGEALIGLTPTIMQFILLAGHSILLRRVSNCQFMLYSPWLKVGFEHLLNIFSTIVWLYYADLLTTVGCCHCFKFFELV